MFQRTKKLIILEIKCFITCILSKASEINIAAAASTTIRNKVEPTVIFSPTPFKKVKNIGTQINGLKYQSLCHKVAKIKVSENKKVSSSF